VNAGPPLAALAAALLVWPPGGSLPGHRLRAVRGSARGRWAAARARPRAGQRADAVRRRLLAGVAGLAAALLLGGGATALAVGVALAVLADRFLGRSAAHRTGGIAHRRALARDLPAACDLFGVCLGAGVPVSGAVAAVADATGPPLAEELRAVEAMYRLGAAPREAWCGAAAELQPLGRVLVRAGESGSSVAAALAALAAEARASERAATEERVRRAGVWVLAPLGACFLPAFVCLGVVPLVLGIAGQVFR
jgi:pilus assembly protein TadC